jgi:ribosomal protein L27
MDAARDVAAQLARDGILVVRQRGADVDITTAVGAVRLARGPHW